jgi:hypothetical protein
VRVAVVEYVMVPVPEELAPKVLDFVSWKGRPRPKGRPEADTGAQRPADDPASAPDPVGGPIARAVAGLDDVSRALVAIVAAASLDQERLTVPEAAKRAGLTTREVVGTVVEVNNLVVEAGGPPIAILVTGLEGAAEAEFTWDNRVVTMNEPIARPFAELVQA